MEKEDEKRYEALFEMFNTKGWEYYMKDITDFEDAVNSSTVDSAVTNDQWQYARGQIHQLRSILGFENFTRSCEENQREDGWRENVDTV